MKLHQEYLALKIFAEKKTREKTMKKGLLNDDNFIKSLPDFYIKKSY
ncbi:MAG: hypothetical protein OEY49_10480 [Candidatus Heimdallarchaeota archaeon]|nr:hypothetical protein [Candidatus Heimdallarchaeota archaeon]